MIVYPYDLETFAIVTLTVLIFAISMHGYTSIMSFKQVPKLESANEQQQECAVFNSGYNIDIPSKCNRSCGR
jgi:hypothetical protein